MTDLTEHFDLSEFTTSQTAARMGRSLNPPPDVVENLRRLCETVLEPIRIQLGRPIIVTSGYRPDWLNIAIGGAAKSAHMTGRAADIRVSGMAPDVLCKWIRNRGITVDKCIEEFGQWVHVQVPEVGKAARNEFLTARSVAGSTVYGVMA